MCSRDVMSSHFINKTLRSWWCRLFYLLLLSVCATSPRSNIWFPFEPKKVFRRKTFFSIFFSNLLYPLIPNRQEICHKILGKIAEKSAENSRNPQDDWMEKKSAMYVVLGYPISLFSIMDSTAYLALVHQNLFCRLRMEIFVGSYMRSRSFPSEFETMIRNAKD